MASCMSMITRVGGVALRVLQPVARQCSKQRTGVIVPHRLSQHRGAQSTLYEHVREGYSDKPELDMRAVCEETDKVIANVESRKGDLRGDDVRKIVSGYYKGLCHKGSYFHLVSLTSHLHKVNMKHV